MKLALLAKTLHVLSAAFFFGGGLVSAYYKWRGDRSGDPQTILWCQREIVRADWWFTVPAGVLLPATGLYLVYAYKLPLTAPWILFGLIGYGVTGLLWLPAAFLQIRMRKLAEQALASNGPLPPAFARANRIWFWLGVPAFALSVLIIWAMVAKWSAFAL